jgi:hypothetical protein
MIGAAIASILNMVVYETEDKAWKGKVYSNGCICFRNASLVMQMQLALMLIQSRDKSTVAQLIHCIK